MRGVFQNSVSLRIRPACADVSVYFGAALNSFVFHVIPVSIVGVDAKVFLVTSADPCRTDDSTALLIGRSSTSVTWILIFVGSPIRRSPSH